MNKLDFADCNHQFYYKYLLFVEGKGYIWTCDSHTVSSLSSASRKGYIEDFTIKEAMHPLHISPVIDYCDYVLKQKRVNRYE